MRGCVVHHVGDYMHAGVHVGLDCKVHVEFCSAAECMQGKSAKCIIQGVEVRRESFERSSLNCIDGYIWKQVRG